MIPFSGTSSLKQYVPNKPNPVGLKSFVLANPDGLVLDFCVYAGKDTFVNVKSTNDKWLGGKAVVALVDSFTPGTVIYCDRYFTSLPLLSELLAAVYWYHTEEQDKCSWQETEPRQRVYEET